MPQDPHLAPAECTKGWGAAQRRPAESSRSQILPHPKPWSEGQEFHFLYIGVEPTPRQTQTNTCKEDTEAEREQNVCVATGQGAAPGLRKLLLPPPVSPRVGLRAPPLPPARSSGVSAAYGLWQSQKEYVEPALPSVEC